MKSKIITHKISKLFTSVCLGFLLMAIWCGCTSKYGALKQSTKISEIFETNQILSDHTYYYHGFQHIPYAIIGIDHQFTLRASGWNQIKLTPVFLEQLIDRMRNVYAPLPHGARILGPDGERLGIWYSPRRVTAVRLASDNQILIATPVPPEVRGIR